MERAGKALTKLKFESLSTPELVRAAWPIAMGKRLARHTVAIDLVRDRLIVEVEDAIWQKQLFHLRYQILKRLAEIVGESIVQDIEFRIAPKRRPPQPAARLTPTHPADSTDEADRIDDPLFRLIYRQARKKATA
jgi:hypothetical protein